jgi:hypothetical protein
MAVLPQNYPILQLFAVPHSRDWFSHVFAWRDSANHYRPPFRYDAVLLLPVTLGLLEKVLINNTLPGITSTPSASIVFSIPSSVGSGPHFRFSLQ